MDEVIHNRYDAEAETRAAAAEETVSPIPRACACENGGRAGGLHACLDLLWRTYTPTQGRRQGSHCIVTFRFQLF